MSRRPYSAVSINSSDASTEETITEPLEQGDYVQFIKYIESGVRGEFDRLTAAGYITKVCPNGDFIIEFNDRIYRVQPGACRMLCKQFRIPGV